jgi:nucleoid-associated protein YgaU
VATESAPPAPVAVQELPPPADVNTSAVEPQAPVAKVEPAAPEAPAAPVEMPVAQVETPAAPAQSAVTENAEGVAYTVKGGDTLMRISWEQYGDLFRWREIYALNKAKIADPNHVPPGTVLQIAGQGRSPASAMEHNGEQYLIVIGDTLGKISGKVYGSMEKWKKIWENNKQLIRDPNKIYAGFYLYYVPEAKMTSTEEGTESGAASET